jgi:hypothetical protein
VTTQESLVNWAAQQIGGSFGGIPSSSVRIAGLTPRMTTSKTRLTVDSSYCGDEWNFDCKYVLLGEQGTSGRKLEPRDAPLFII